MRILLVDALASTGAGKRLVTVDVIGAGPRTVVGVLESLGIDVDLRVIDEVLSNRSVMREYDVLMISAMSVDEASVKRVIRNWRREKHKAPVILGGPITSDPYSLIRVGADIGIHGESEPVLVSLFKTIDMNEGVLDTDELRNMCGVMYLGNDKKVHVNRRCPIMPRRVWEQYRPSTRIITSYPLFWAARVYVEVVRGCSNYNFPDLDGIVPSELLPDKPRPGCAYCSVVHLWGYARSRSVEHVYEEVKELIKMGVRRIVLSGPDFLDYGRDWLVEPHPLVNPRKPPPNLEAIERLLKNLSDLPEVSAGEAKVMVENVKPNLVTEEVAEVLGRYLRGTPIHIGAEVGDDKLLRALGRPALTSDVLRAVKLLHSHGIRPYIYIMYCLPGETSETIKKTLRYMEKLYNLGAEKITAYKFTPLPGSYLEKLRQVGKLCTKGLHPVKAKAIELNKKAKKKLIGRVTRFIVVNFSERYRGYIAYPLAHGPVTVLRGIRKLDKGCIIEGRITSVISDRVVEAYPLRIVKCSDSVL